MDYIAELLKVHFLLQRGMYFDNRLLLSGCSLYTSDIITDSFWNYAFVPKNTDLRHILKFIEENFLKLNRQPAIYLGDPTDDEVRFLSSAGYDLVSEESFMTCQVISKLKVSNLEIIRVTSDKEKSDFLEVFVNVFGGEKTLDSPYGALDEAYLKALEQNFFDQKFYHFIAYYGHHAVSIASLCYSNGMCGIYNVGTREGDRGKGFGTSIVWACLEQYLELHGSTLLLQTETKSQVERWYEALGFKTKFYGKIYVKNCN